MDEIISKQFVCMYMYKCNVGDVPTTDMCWYTMNVCSFLQVLGVDFLHGHKYIIIS